MIAISIDQYRYAVNVGSATEIGRLLPDGLRIYAIGDVHGHLGLLRAMSAAIDQIEASLPAANSHELFLGDYVDRGPDAAGVIEWLSSPSLKRSRVCLRGNHEWLLQAYLAEPDSFDGWRAVGGGDTLASYGIERRLQADRLSRTRVWREFQLALPKSHRSFLSGLPNFHRIGPYFFAHAGVRPGISIENQAERDLLWIRSEFLESDAEFGAMVVHGHSPTRDVEFHRNRIAVDTGAYATGLLSGVMLEGTAATVVQVRFDGLT